MNITVLIPAKNEEDCLPIVLAELREVIPDAELLVVDGYSTDQTAAVAEAAGAKVVRQVGGPGYGRGVESGIKEAAGEFIVFFDADGSYDPKAISRLFERLQRENLDAVFCSRYLPTAGSDDDTWIRLLGNKVFTLLMRLFFSVRISDSLFLYALVRKSALQKLTMKSHGFDWCIEFPIRLHQKGLKYAEIPQRERPRLAGISKVNALIDGWKILMTVLKLRFVRNQS